MANHLTDLTGLQFGKLLVLARAENDRNGNPRWLCRCEGCGREVVVYGKTLRSGRSQSCGDLSCRRRKSEPVALPDLTPTPEEVTLCLDCKKALGWCPWSTRFEPVPGWDAVPTVIDEEPWPIRSYYVRACPLFEADR